MLRPQLVFFRRFSRSEQVTQRFVLRIRNPHCCEVTGLVGTREPLSIAAIGLDSIAGLHWHERWRDHLALHAKLRQLPVECIARGPRFVANLHLGQLAELPDKSSNSLRSIGNRAQRPHLVSSFRYRHHDRLRMHIRSCILAHRPAPFAMWLCSSSLAARSVTHDLATRAGRSIMTRQSQLPTLASNVDASAPTEEASSSP